MDFVPVHIGQMDVPKRLLSIVCRPLQIIRPGFPRILNEKMFDTLNEPVHAPSSLIFCLYQPFPIRGIDVELDNTLELFNALSSPKV